MTPEPYSEADTRQQIIDRRLRLAGWDVDDPSQVSQELEIQSYITGGKPPVGRESGSSNYAGRQFADYALVLRGKPTAVVEAKKTSRDAQVGQEQARQYAERLQRIHGDALPFVLYTNGHEIFFWDSVHYPPAPVAGFPTRDDLEWLAQRRETQRPLSVELINSAIAGRDYQADYPGIHGGVDQGPDGHASREVHLLRRVGQARAAPPG
ncbi:MAG: hypothetical protein HY701_11975, partial [Gemmatimonadetes bacterium]|nr:hypothetical protein [Gemmatimonadota bacterium]